MTHPDLTDKPVQGSFVISRVGVSPVTINLDLSRNYQKTINITVQTSEGTSLSNARLVYDPADQPGGSYPQGVTLTVGSPKNVGSGQKVNLPFTIWADNTAADNSIIKLRVVSGNTEITEHGKVTINASFRDAQPVLYFSPNLIETGVAWGNTEVESVTLQNKGLGDMEGITLSLHNQDGTPAWVYLNSPANQGTLAVGEGRRIDIAFSPTQALAPEGIYTFYLRVTSDNYPARNIYLTAAVTQSGTGNVLFKISDIYTATLNQNNQLIQGVASAKIKVQNEEVLTITQTLTTDSVGEALFTDLPAGRYKYRITASNHQEQTGRFWIKPGITATQEVFLDYNLVTVEWSVNEITIEDRYEITLNTTFVTDVPAAVVVARPSSAALPKMKAGDVFSAEFTLTNYGLIRADNLRVAMPANDGNFKYEILGGIPESLGAKESITIPYRVTCLVSLENDEGTGGGCGTYVRCGRIEYIYICANNKENESKTTYCVTYTPNCGSGLPGPPTPPPPCTGDCEDDITDGGGGGLPKPPPKPAPAPTPLADEFKCYPDPGRKECDPCKNKVVDQHQEILTGSSVNTRLREYNRDEIDLSVKASPGSIDIKRFYRDGKWYMGFSDNDWSWPLSIGPGVPLSASFFKFYLDEKPATGIVTAIIKDGVVYKLPAENFFLKTVYDPYGNIIDQHYEYTGQVVYRHATYTITGIGPYHWETRTGIFREYDGYGRLTSHGNRLGSARSRWSRLLRSPDRVFYLSF